MDLQTTDIVSIAPQLPGISESIELQCQRIKELEERGEFEAASEAFTDLGLWEGVGYRPNTNGLNPSIQAELLLRAGTLTGWLGSARQMEGAQEVAKDLITESARIFESIELTERSAEACVDLAICYWREGALDEARVTLREVLNTLGDQEGDVRLRALLNIAIVERTATRYREALRIDINAAPLFEKSSNHLLRGKFHNGFGLALKNLGLAEGRTDYIDRAFIEFTAAGFHLEQAGNQRLLAPLENNMGFLFLRSGKVIEAHQHLNRARALYLKLKDKGGVAQVDDTRARAFLAEGQIQKAELVARSSVRALEQGDEKALLAESLITHATALARLDRYQSAFTELKLAVDLAQQAGAIENAGIAALTIVEELPGQLSTTDLTEYLQRAESLLINSQHTGIHARLGQSARQILAARYSRPAESTADEMLAPVTDSARVETDGSGTPALAGASDDSSQSWTGCSLDDEVLRYEGDLIRRALQTAGGSVTRAARLLGITHQGLAFILNGRHKSLLNARTPAKSRRRSVFRAH